MSIPRNLSEILRFLSIPRSFQIEKAIRKLFTPQFTYLIDGINDIPQVGFAVAMERRFHYDLDIRLGSQNPGYYFINASFLDSIGVFDSNNDGIKIYFGFDNLQNKIIPILTKVDVTRYDIVTGDIEMMNIAPYYIPTESTNGDWTETDQSVVLRDNYKSIVEQINQVIEIGGSKKYKTEGYYIGKDALMNVMSDAIGELFSTNVVKSGIKLYFGIQEDLPYYDYEKGKKKEVGGGLSVQSLDRDLHLILVGVNNSNLGPLASFERIFATIETDVNSISDGILTEIVFDQLLPSGMPCVVPDPQYPSQDS